MKKILIPLVVFILFFSNCATLKRMADPIGQIRYPKYKEILDPMIGEDKETVISSVISRGFNQKIKEYTVVDPDPSAFRLPWSNERLYFFPKESVEEIFSKKGTYCIIILQHYWGFESGGLHTFNISEEQRRYYYSYRGRWMNRAPWDKIKIYRGMSYGSTIDTIPCFDRIQLTFLDDKLIHWCFQAISLG